MCEGKTALFCRFLSLWVFCFPGIYRGLEVEGIKNRVFDKGQTAALFSTFSFGHVLQVRSLQPPSQCLAFYPFIKHQKEMLQKRVLQHLLIFGAQCLKRM